MTTPRRFALLFTALAALTISCHRYDCESVSRRLYLDCKTWFALGPDPCIDQLPISSDDDGLVLPLRLCEAADPVGDEQCYLTESCVAIGSDACSHDIPMRNPACLDRCDQALSACDDGCRSAADRHACEDCWVGCVAHDTRCRRSC